MYRWSTPGCKGNRMKVQGISVTRHLLPSYWTTLTPKHTGDLFKVASTLMFLGCNPIHSPCFPFPTHIWYASSTSLFFFFFCSSKLWLRSSIFCFISLDFFSFCYIFVVVSRSVITFVWFVCSFVFIFWYCIVECLCSDFVLLIRSDDT